MSGDSLDPSRGKVRARQISVERPQRPPRSVELAINRGERELAPAGSYRDARIDQISSMLRHGGSSLETVRGADDEGPGSRRGLSPDPFGADERLKRGRSMRSAEVKVFEDDGASILDTYFDNLLIRSGNEDELAPDSRPHSPESDTKSRKSINYSMPSADCFPAPFQHRPPGQFHLPWSPTRPTQTPSTYAGFGLATPPISPPRSHGTSKASAEPQSPVSSTFAIKAMYGDAIVVLKAERNSDLFEVRHRIWDKFVNQEGVQLSEDFILSYKKSSSSLHNGTTTRSGGRQRSMSTSTVSTISSISSIDPSMLSFIVLTSEWKNVAMACGSKLTLIILDS